MIALSDDVVTSTQWGAIVAAQRASMVETRTLEFRCGGHSMMSSTGHANCVVEGARAGTLPAIEVTPSTRGIPLEDVEFK